MELRVGISEHSGAREAVVEAARAALADCASPAFALVLCTFEYDADDVARAVGAAVGALPWAGLVTSAILHGQRVLSRGVAIGVLDSSELRVGVGAAMGVGANAHDAGRRAALAALEGMPLPPRDRSRAMLLFVDTIGADAADALHGAVSVAGAGVAWSGGGTGVGAGGRRGAQFAGGRALRDHVVAVMLDCSARVGVGVQHGFQPSGAPAMVTRTEGSLVERLEHRPAIEIYRTAAQERGQELDAERFASFATSHPLGIPQADGEHLIRDLLSVDEAGAIRLVAGVPDGALVRVMDGTPDMLIAAARVAASVAREDAGGPVGGAFVFDCVSRSSMLGERLREELAACEAGLGAGVPLLGCLTFGEVGAFGARMPQFHNKTMVVLALPRQS